MKDEFKIAEKLDKMLKVNNEQLAYRLLWQWCKEDKLSFGEFMVILKQYQEKRVVSI